MRKTLLLFICCIALISCNSKKTEQVTTENAITDSVTTEKSNYEITCNGARNIMLSSTVTEIETLVGKENMQYDSVFAEGEFATMSLVVFKDKPEELIFYSQEESEIPFKNISAIKIQQKNSPYSFANGIKIGTPIAELEKLNGNVPVSFTGFGWDYEGGFLSFNKGKLETELPCFGGRFYFDDKSTNQNEVLGDAEFKSNQPEVKKIGVYVSEIIIANRH
ncbi:MAG: hypothetical protein V4667_02240 [Bacteroidota bacterium]